MFPGLSRNGPLARVIRKVDYAINCYHRILHYQVLVDSVVCPVTLDSYPAYPLDSYVSSG